MPFTVDQLALTADRRAALEAALANAGLTDPLGQVLAEAEAEVARLAAGFDLTDETRLHLVRRIALYNLFVLAEMAVPEDVRAAYSDAMGELRALASGQRANAQPSDPARLGAWGSRKTLQLAQQVHE